MCEHCAVDAAFDFLNTFGDELEVIADLYKCPDTLVRAALAGILREHAAFRVRDNAEAQGWVQKSETLGALVFAEELKTQLSTSEEAEGAPEAAKSEESHPPPRLRKMHRGYNKRLN